MSTDCPCWLLVLIKLLTEEKSGTQGHVSSIDLGSLISKCLFSITHRNLCIVGTNIYDIKRKDSNIRLRLKWIDQTMCIPSV